LRMKLKATCSFKTSVKVYPSFLELSTVLLGKSTLVSSSSDDPKILIHISVSCIQWLCVSPTSTTSPASRLEVFFSSLYAALKRGARAVLQFYPDSEEQVSLIMGVAMKCGFGGGLVIDHPESIKRKKLFLVLWAG
jgi:hypothetical protein